MTDFVMQYPPRSSVGARFQRAPVERLDRRTGRLGNAPLPTGSARAAVAYAMPRPLSIWPRRSLGEVGTHAPSYGVCQATE